MTMVPARRSMVCSSRRFSSPQWELRPITWPSSLNCMIAAAFCIRASSTASGPAVPAVAADHQLVDRQVAHDAHGEPQNVKRPVVLDERLDQGVVVMRAALPGRLAEQFGEQVAVVVGEGLQGSALRVAAGQ